MHANGLADLVMALPVPGKALATSAAGSATEQEQGSAGTPFTAALAAEMLLQAMGAQLPAAATVIDPQATVTQPIQSATLVAQVLPKTGQVPVATPAAQPQPTPAAQAVALPDVPAGEQSAQVVEPVAADSQPAEAAVPNELIAPVLPASPEATPAVQDAVVPQSTPTPAPMQVQATVTAPVAKSGETVTVSEAESVQADAQAQVTDAVELPHVDAPATQHETAAQQGEIDLSIQPEQPASQETLAPSADEPTTTEPQPVPPTTAQHAPAAPAARTVKPSKGIGVYRAASAQQEHRPAGPVAPVAARAAAAPVVQVAVEPVIQAIDPSQSGDPRVQNGVDAIPSLTHANGPSFAPSQPLTAPSIDQPAKAALADQVTDQRTWSSLQAGGASVTIRLDPPELGQVRLRLQQDGDGVRGVMEVQNPRTLVQLQSEAPAMAVRLADSGVQLRRMDVILAEPAPTGQGQGFLPNDDGQQQQNQFGSQQHSPGQQQAGPGQPGQWVPEAAADQTEPVAAVAGDGSVNVWM